MKQTHVITRFIAVLLLVIPGVTATSGFLLMKNAVFDYVVDHGNDKLSAPAFQWLPFTAGLLLFIIGVGFIGGWIFYRDRKRNYVASRFRAKKSPKPQSFRPSADGSVEGKK
ncbi:DUF2627 domain-containing protein [Paenibacillus alvei]|uniref:DUF2627 domain-containing protein n=1 Tax=Paenibacillus alvei TaxID=44250 RepID=A0A383RCN1_PAEAL|nr:DUF2627 domain-containing protein [Paenibacillus alvei]SYX84758.1 conserved protein of unknown function [Paenibacillus alvei]